MVAPRTVPGGELGSGVPAGRGAWEEALPALMVRYQQGDPAAVDELVSQLSGPLMRFLSAFALPRADTEDLLQECWIRVHKARHTYRAPQPVLPWIFAIARHARVDSYRRRRRRSAHEVLVPSLPDRGSSGSDGGEQPDLAEFDRMLESLPESQREVIVMLKVTEMSVEEVARATSSTVGAVKQKVHRAYEKLRLVLGKGRSKGMPNG
ncbi:RNA polymerase sigma factor [Bryobacterales bacterium F-183]|nr:RNA polymerase sigma factor [Bryobacterales bacterium F-183]